jgi:hypothetical protein
MEINKRYIAIGLVIAFSLFLALAAHADEADENTIITFSQPIQIPGRVLPAGTYQFKLASNDDLSTVQIYNADRTVVLATLPTIATERPKPTSFTVVALAEQGDGRPDVLVKWFYPGNETGREFVYSNQQEKELARDKKDTVAADRPTKSNSDVVGAGN